MQDASQGIVHMIGPELGATKPGMTIVCGDSHTSTHGAFGALAFGIGTSEVEHVMATQTLPQSKPKTFRITVEGELPFGVTAKDIILDIIGQHRHRRRHRLRHRVRRLRHPRALDGRPHDHLQHEHRSRRPRRHDRSRRDHLRLPQGPPLLARRAQHGTKPSRTGARCPPTTARTFDRELHIDAATLAPAVTWGTSPGMVTTIDGTVPTLDDATTEADRKSPSSAPTSTWASSPARRIEDIKIDTVFLGSCTNGRIEDLRAAATVVKGHHVATNVRAMVVPGSQAVKRQAEEEGLDAIFKTAGFEWREPGCSHVPRHEPRHPAARRTLRLHPQPQLRRPPGPRRPHPPRLARDGRRRRHHRPLHRHPQMEAESRKRSRGQR